jgi:hypothetical protein
VGIIIPKLGNYENTQGTVIYIIQNESGAHIKIPSATTPNGNKTESMSPACLFSSERLTKNMTLISIKWSENAYHEGVLNTSSD